MSPDISVFDFITPIDWAVFIIAQVLTIGAVVYGHRRRVAAEKESLLDLLLMGRQLTLPMFVATLVATWYGGIFGVTEIAFSDGIYNFVTQGLFWYVAYLIFAFYLVDRVAKFKAVTLPDLVGQMFGPRSARLSAIFNFCNVLPVASRSASGSSCRPSWAGAC